MNIIYSHRAVARLFVLIVWFGLLGSSIGSFSTPTAWAAPPPCNPTITFTSVPPFGSLDNKILSGRVGCVTPANFKVAVYIYVSGWWTKPTHAQPLTDIGIDGTWSTNIVTGGVDQLATRIAAFLLPIGYNPPLLPPLGGSSQTLPQTLFDSSVAYRIIDRYRTIEFSGFTWNVKSSEAAPSGPGPNYFSADQNGVWVDASGNLHLTIIQRNSRWYCTEVFTQAPLGYGTYTFVLASPIDQLERNAVLGLFTWDDNAPQNNYREIDVEFSKWGDPVADNSQYVVQPFDRVGNIHRFNSTLSGVYSTHRFEWESDRVVFSSRQGHLPNLGTEIQSWTYTGTDTPPEGGANARINLWLYNGVAPSDGQPIEVVIEAFDHVPVPNADTTGVFRPSNGLLYLKDKNETGFADKALNYGMPGDYPVVGDWDGNGTMTIGVYRNGIFYLRNSNTVGFADIVFGLGNPGDIPIAGDWNGDGRDTVGVFRRINGIIFLKNSNTTGIADIALNYGIPGDKPVTGDWDKDGIDTIGVYRNGVFYLRNSNTPGFADLVFPFGQSADQPIAGDWNNDGMDTIGVYHGSAATFDLRNSNSSGNADVSFVLGIPGDMPIAGDWDGLP